MRDSHLTLAYVSNDRLYCYRRLKVYTSVWYCDTYDLLVLPWAGKALIQRLNNTLFPLFTETIISAC